jgi:hypothetical protein
VLTIHHPSSVEVKERADLHHYFLSGLSWPVLGYSKVNKELPTNSRHHIASYILRTHNSKVTCELHSYLAFLHMNCYILLYVKKEGRKYNNSAENISCHKV